MKKKSIIVFFLFYNLCLQAQDNFYFSQYFQVGPIINPATTGIDNFLDIKLSNRNQWTGFSDAPSSNYFGVNGYLQKETQKSYSQYSLRTSNPNYLDSLPPMEISLGDQLRQGIGGSIVYDIQGPYSQITGYLNYALHFPLGKKLKISVGLSADIINQRIDMSKITVSNPDDDEFYQALLASGGRNTYFDINPGVMLYNEKFYISYAAFQAYRLSISSDDILTSNNNINHNVMTGLKIPLSQRVKLLPSMLLNYSKEFGNLWDANLRVLINERTWAGMSYKSTKAVVFMGGVYINNLINLSYSYDYVTSDLNQYTSGSHEIIIGLMLFKKDLKAPYLW